MSRIVRVTGLSNRFDEKSLWEIFDVPANQLKSVRLVRDGFDSSKNAGYAYLEFASHADAVSVLSNVQGRSIEGPFSGLQIKLVEDSLGSKVDSFQVYVGGLSEEVSDQDLYAYFRELSEEVTNASIVRDGRNISRGFGFIQFQSDESAYKTVSLLNSAFCSRKALGSSSFFVREAYRRSRAEIERGVDHIDNSTIFVGNVNLSVTEDKFRESFSKFGDIQSCRIVANRGFGFITFSDHVAAYAALSEMQNVKVLHQRVYCSWGRLQCSSAREAEGQSRKKDLDEDDYYSAMFPLPLKKKPRIKPESLDRSKLLQQALKSMAPREESEGKTGLNQAFIRAKMLNLINHL